MSQDLPPSSPPASASPDRTAGAGAGPVSGLILARRLWGGYLLRYWPKLAVAAAAMAAYAASAAAIPAGVEWINAALSGAPPRAPLAGAIAGPVGVWGPVIILSLGAFNAAALYVQARFSASASLCALRDLQAAMFDKLLGVDDAQLRSFGAGQTISRLTNDIAVLRETLTRTLTALRDLLTLLALCAVMIYYDGVLFAVVVGIYAAVGWPVARIGARLRTGSREAQAQSGEIAALAGEAVTGGRMVRVYDLAQRLGLQARTVFDRRLATLQRMARLRAANEPFIFFVGAAALALVIAVVALRIEAGALDVPQFIAFIIALLMVSQPARGLSTLNAVTQEGFGAFERMLALIDAEPAIRDRAGAAPLVVDAGAIAFQDVAFAYDGASGAALDGFTLMAPAGRTTALIGESGSGKSTVFNLLTRLYEPQSGRILIDGQDIAGVSMSSLRAAMAVVSQETILFDDTVSANIGFGRAGARRDEIIAAAEAASADTFIRALPNGYDTRVGEGGGMLSGGQRQRIAIARAFLKNAPILLLDEATSALDAESEAAVQAALARLAAGRTTLVIAHRLSTVRTADLIVAMHRGVVVETGAHDEMLARGGYYANAARLQLASA